MPGVRKDALDDDSKKDWMGRVDAPLDNRINRMGGVGHRVVTLLDARQRQRSAQDPVVSLFTEPATNDATGQQTLVESLWTLRSGIRRGYM